MHSGDRDPRRSGLSDDAVRAYDRILKRVHDSVDNFEDTSWPYIKEKIDEAVELELTAREMTREEMDLLGAYLRRDLRELGRIAHSTGAGIAALLKFDLEALEQRIVDMLDLLADPARVSQTDLAQRLDHGPEDYLAGEVATLGRFRCLACGQIMKLHQTQLLEPCHQCGERYFHREHDVS